MIFNNKRNKFFGLLFCSVLGLKPIIFIDDGFFKYLCPTDKK